MKFWNLLEICLWSHLAVKGLIAIVIDVIIGPGKIVTISTENCKRITPFSISNARIQDWYRAHGNLNSGSTERHFSFCRLFSSSKALFRQPPPKRHKLESSWKEKNASSTCSVYYLIVSKTKYIMQVTAPWDALSHFFEFFMPSTVTTSLSLSSVIVQKSLNCQVIDS